MGIHNDEGAEMPKPMTEAQFNYAMSLIRETATDPSHRVTLLTELGNADFASVSPLIDLLKLAKAAKTDPKPVPADAYYASVAAPAPAPTTPAELAYLPPAGYYVIDGKAYQLKPNKYNDKIMYVYGGYGNTKGAYFGLLTATKNTHIVEALSTPDKALEAVKGYADFTGNYGVAKCGVCNTKLSDPKSIAARVGPVCIKKYGKLV
jgi:hypothetical protein